MSGCLWHLTVARGEKLWSSSAGTQQAQAAGNCAISRGQSSPNIAQCPTQPGALSLACLSHPMRAGVHGAGRLAALLGRYTTYLPLVGKYHIKAAFGSPAPWNSTLNWKATCLLHLFTRCNCSRGKALHAEALWKRVEVCLDGEDKETHGHA